LTNPALAARLPEVAFALLIGAVAYLARLVPVVRGGGLRGMNSYDGAVYYAAAAGLAHGCCRIATSSSCTRQASSSRSYRLQRWDESSATHTAWRRPLLPGSASEH
jgi:hypothetical protein